MSATIVQGETILITADDSVIGINTNANIAFNGDTRGTNYKGSGAFKGNKAGRGEFNITCTGLYDLNDPGQAVVDAKVLTPDRRVVLYFDWGGVDLSCDFIITQAEKAHPDQEDSTYNYAFISDGEPQPVITGP